MLHRRCLAYCQLPAILPDNSWFGWASNLRPVGVEIEKSITFLHHKKKLVHIHIERMSERRRRYNCFRKFHFIVFNFLDTISSGLYSAERGGCVITRMRGEMIFHRLDNSQFYTPNKRDKLWISVELIIVFLQPTKFIQFNLLSWAALENRKLCAKLHSLQFWA